MARESGPLRFQWKTAQVMRTEKRGDLGSGPWGRHREPKRVGSGRGDLLAGGLERGGLDRGGVPPDELPDADGRLQGRQRVRHRRHRARLLWQSLRPPAAMVRDRHLVAQRHHGDAPRPLRGEAARMPRGQLPRAARLSRHAACRVPVQSLRRSTRPLRRMRQGRVRGAVRCAAGRVSAGQGGRVRGAPGERLGALLLPRDGHVSRGVRPERPRRARPRRVPIAAPVTCPAVTIVARPAEVARASRTEAQRAAAT
jgi:hypothetical protein